MVYSDRFGALVVATDDGFGSEVAGVTEQQIGNSVSDVCPVDRKYKSTMF